jgi:hypothetical protein
MDFHILVVEPAPLKNMSQWEGLIIHNYRIYEMENKKGLKPPASISMIYVYDGLSKCQNVCFG